MSYDVYWVKNRAEKIADFEHPTIKGNMARVSNSQCNTNRDILLFDLANFQASKAVTTFNKQIQTQVVSIIS